MKRFIPILGILLIAATLLACGESTNTGTKAGTSSTSSTQPAAPAQHFKVGDVVNVGSTWQVTISNVRTVSPGQYDSVKPGDSYLGVDVNFKNISSKEASLYGNADWTLKDTSGQKYDNAYVLNFPSPPDGKVEAGDPAKGSLIFEVPSATHDFRLAYEQTMFESGQTIWDLTV